MRHSAARAGDNAGTDNSGDVTAWVISPHLLVAQAVTAALQSGGVSVELHAWDDLVRQVGPPEPDTVRHVVAIFDNLVTPTMVDEVRHFVALGNVRIAVVTTDAAATGWGGLVGNGSVDVVTMVTTIGLLAEVVGRFTAGQDLMEAETRVAMQEAWKEALDKQQDLLALIRTLSPRQLRVLELLASGRRVREVAELMGVADGTVRSHVKTLRHKIGARSQLEAVAMLRQVHELGGTAADLVPRPRQAPVAATG